MSRSSPPLLFLQLKVEGTVPALVPLTGPSLVLDDLVVLVVLGIQKGLSLFRPPRTGERFMDLGGSPLELHTPGGLMRSCRFTMHCGIGRNVECKH